jgi:ATP-dependent Clp protease, protease subunit
MAPSMPQDKDPILADKDNSELLQQAGMYVFMDDVTSESIKPIIEWILVENHVVKKNKKKELLLMICSDGGSLSDAFALIDVMRASTIPVKTIGLGSIASAGLCIFIAGEKGRRVLTPNTSILSHQYSWGNEGAKAHELFSQVKEFDLMFNRMLNLYRESTGLDDELIKQHLLPASDVWLSADEALNLNICDFISDLKK